MCLSSRKGISITVRRLVAVKKRLTVLLAFVLLLSFLFALPTGAVTRETLMKYYRFVGGGDYDPQAKNLGGYHYWEEQINKNKWTGETRPEALMGDANIDGKVNAMDALFALHFSVYGNRQTWIITSHMKTPPQLTWYDPLRKAYKNGTSAKLANDKRQWLTYCWYNSPFFADVTKDCIVNAKDALEILKYSVGKAENFPEGDFTFIDIRFSYYPWPTEYYPGFFEDHLVDMTDKEFCEKYNFNLDVSPTNQ